MREARCAMAPRVEAKRDGRVDAGELAALACHVAECAACRALERDFERLADLAQRPSAPPATPAEHERGRAALILVAAMEVAPDRMTPGPVQLAPDGTAPLSHRRPASVGTARWIAISLAAALALALFSSFSSSSALPRRGASRPAVARHLPPLPRLATEEADFLALTALQRAGRTEAAAEAARRYLARYPTGAHRAEAQAIAAGR